LYATLHSVNRDLKAIIAEGFPAASTSTSPYTASSSTAPPSSPSTSSPLSEAKFDNIINDLLNDMKVLFAMAAQWSPAKEDPHKTTVAQLRTHVLALCAAAVRVSKSQYMIICIIYRFINFGEDWFGRKGGRTVSLFVEGGGIAGELDDRSTVYWLVSFPYDGFFSLVSICQGLGKFPGRERRAGIDEGDWLGLSEGGEPFGGREGPPPLPGARSHLVPFFSLLPPSSSISFFPSLCHSHLLLSSLLQLMDFFNSFS